MKARIKKTEQECRLALPRAGVIFDLVVTFAQSQKPDSTSRYPVVTLVPNESRSNIEAVREAYQPIKLIE